MPKPLDISPLRLYWSAKGDLSHTLLMHNPKIKVGYSLKVSQQLKGELDYFLQIQNQLLVIEAK